MTDMDDSFRLFKIRQKRQWGDFGSILLSGFVLDTDESGRLMLARTGPMIPPISFPSGRCVVTEEIRNQLEASSLRGLGFREVVKQRMVRVNWHEWDRSKDLTAEQLPPSEPEDYVMKGRHSKKLAENTPRLWQVIPPALLEFVGLPDGSSGVVRDDSLLASADFFRSRAMTVIVNEQARDFIDSLCHEWCEFEALFFLK